MMDKKAKANAERIGRDLCYDQQFFRDLAKATTDVEIQRCMASARKRLPDEWGKVA